MDPILPKTAHEHLYKPTNYYGFLTQDETPNHYKPTPFSDENLRRNINDYIVTNAIGGTEMLRP
ncbi:hypothetical protein HY041_04355, partial [Candidatus Roizmanbacteria bacterium]|nr:hypothetical protein [Candidatus Roizmanbacteria bacterium]